MQNSELALRLTAVFESAPEGGFTCHFVEFPEVFSQGETIEEARANLADALHEVMAYHRSIEEGQATAGVLREEFHLVSTSEAR